MRETFKQCDRTVLKDVLELESGTSIMPVRSYDVTGEEVTVLDARFVIGQEETGILPDVRSQWSGTLGLRHQPAE